MLEFSLHCFQIYVLNLMLFYLTEQSIIPCSEMRDTYFMSWNAVEYLKSRRYPAVLRPLRSMHMALSNCKHILLTLIGPKTRTEINLIQELKSLRNKMKNQQKTSLNIQRKDQQICGV